VCGIAGYLTKGELAQGARNILRAMAGKIAHRGPDAEGLWTAPGVGLAHRRLSIIDLSSGDQPIGNEDGTIQVVFNGEIYNYLDLKSRLEQKGHRFRTHSDTEVLVHLYEEAGDEMVTQLRGMFAFALWDQPRQRLLLARDRVGQKPLYYCVVGDSLLFASELKALLTYPGVRRDIDVESLEDYLAFGVVPGLRTIFREIYKLPAGHLLTASRSDLRPSLRRYWQLRLEPDESLAIDEWKEAVEAKLRETVAAHRIADVPVGAFLSGGLDSSAVTAALVESGAQGLQTFSIGFADSRFNELPYARMIAQRFGTRHVEEIVTPQAAASLEDLVTYFDEPFADASAIPTMHVSRLARQHVKVVLSGDGGDEAFGGYARYAHDLREAALRARLPQSFRKGVLKPISRVWPKADWLPRPVRLKTALANLSLNDAEAYANTIALCRQPLRRRLLHGDVRAQLNGHLPETRIVCGFGEVSGDPLRGMIAADVDMLLPDDFLTKVDRASMAVGLEVRPPLVDHEFLELTARMPSSLKVRDGETKWLFKQICDGWLPADVVRRPKQGFDIPVDDWLRGPLRDQFHDAVLNANAPLASYIDPGVAAGLYESHRRRTARHGNLLWALMVLGRWMSRYTVAPLSHSLAAVR
jgi:asparagine synthase (glutamine-hydrolysing)